MWEAEAGGWPLTSGQPKPESVDLSHTNINAQSWVSTFAASVFASSVISVMF